MDLNTYQMKARETAVYKGKDKHEGLLYTGFAVAAEAGEVAGKLARMMRGDFDEQDAHQWRYDLSMELGDVLWALSQCAHELGYNLEDIGNDNLRKLKERKLRGTLKGEGDNR